MGPGNSPTGRAPSPPNIQAVNPALERLREMGVSYPSRVLREFAESERKLALAVGELSNIAAEALTLFDTLAGGGSMEELMPLLARARELRNRLETACSSVS